MFLSTHAVYTRLALNEIAYILGISTSFLFYTRAAHLCHEQDTPALGYFPFLIVSCPMFCRASLFAKEIPNRKTGSACYTNNHQATGQQCKVAVNVYFV